jgi:hypothetical protein
MLERVIVAAPGIADPQDARVALSASLLHPGGVPSEEGLIGEDETRGSQQFPCYQLG